MKLKATHRFRASPETVFAALNDPEILRQAIGGCEELVPAGDDVFEARVRIGIGAIKGTYKGTVQLRNKKPPESFTLAMKGQGSGGFVNGSADIRLRAQDGGTELEAEAGRDRRWNNRRGRIPIGRSGGTKDDGGLFPEARGPDRPTHVRLTSATGCYVNRTSTSMNAMPSGTTESET